MSNAVHGYGTLLQIGDGGDPETFATIAEVTDLSGPEEKLDTKEVTSHSSPNARKEFIGTLLESGDVSFDINYQPTAVTHAALRTDMQNRTVRNFQIVFSDAGTTTASFAALVTDFKPKEPVDDVLTASVTLKVTGSITLA